MRVQAKTICAFARFVSKYMQQSSTKTRTAAPLAMNAFDRTPSPSFPSAIDMRRFRYAVDPELWSSSLPFVELDFDRAAAAYVERATSARHGRLLTWLHRGLRGFLSDFDINGLLGTYPMHVLSSEQWRRLLDDQLPPSSVPERTLRLLDIGAGRGDVTNELARLFDETVVSETSRPMVKRLKKRGFRVVDFDLAAGRAHLDPFHVVSLLNVLDRCDRPLSLLGRARELIVPGGLLVLALVLPYQPFVYDENRARPPNERLPISSSLFEVAATELVQNALTPLGLSIVRTARAPYLSGGDAEAPLYVLDDLIVVAKATHAPLIL